MMWIRLCFLVTLCLGASTALGFDTVPAVRAGMLRATDLLLNLDVDSAETECRQMLSLPQGEGVGRFCLALATLIRAEGKDDPIPELDRFLKEISEAIAVAEALERAQPADPEVKLLVALAQGSSAMVHGARKNYLAAYRALRESHRRFEEALQLDPNLIDAEYGIGLYNYALGRLPALVKPLVAIALPHEDAARGLQQIERVAERGTFLKMTARAALLQLYTQQEQKYSEALRFGRDLLQRYPRNPDIYFLTAHAASELGHTTEALEIARQVSRNITEHRPHFTPDLLARSNQLLGKIYMDSGDYAAALTFFNRSIQAPTPPRYRWVTAWAWTRSGMIYDLQGDREEAVRRYQKALAVEADSVAGDVARRHLEVPYRGRPASPS